MPIFSRSRLPSEDQPPGVDRRSTGFIIAYALANAGGVIAFLPLLTLLLPLKVEGVAGDARIGVLTAAALAGAVAASLSNIAFGWASDGTVAAGYSRRRWVLGGLVLTILAYGGITLARDATGLVVAIAIWQVALNAMLAPLMAMMADEIPDGQKGVVGGLLALANPVASAVSAMLIAAIALGETTRYAIVCAVSALLILPLLLSPPSPVAPIPVPAAAPSMARTDLALAWLARLLLQTAGCVLFVFLFFYFESIVPNVAPHDLAPQFSKVMAVAYILALPLAVIAGRASDRLAARKPFVFGSALVTSAGLAAMGAANSWSVAVAGFMIYACGSVIFLGLHSAYVMQMLPSPHHRGRDLGLINLTNTLPSIFGPAMTWMLASTHDFGPLLFLLAGIVALAGVAVIPIRSQR